MPDADTVADADTPTVGRLVATADADTVAGPTNNTVPRLMAPAAVTVAPVADKVLV